MLLGKKLKIKKEKLKIGQKLLPLSTTYSIPFLGPFLENGATFVVGNQMDM